MSQNIPEEKAVPPEMTVERWKELIRSEEDLPLTAEEKAAGYHFCPEYDDDVFIYGTREGCACPPPDEGGGSMDTNTQTSSSLDTNQETSQVPQPPVHE